MVVQPGPQSCTVPPKSPFIGGYLVAIITLLYPIIDTCCNMLWTFTFSFLKGLAVMYPWYSWLRATRTLFRIGPPRWNGGLGWGKFYPWCQDTSTLSIFQVVHMQAMFYIHISTSNYLAKESHQTQHHFLWEIPQKRANFCEHGV